MCACVRTCTSPPPALSYIAACLLQGLWQVRQKMNRYQTDNLQKSTSSFSTLCKPSPSPPPAHSSPLPCNPSQNSDDGNNNETSCERARIVKQVLGGNKLETTTKYGDKSSLAEMQAAVYLISALLSITPVFLPPPVHSWSFLAGWKNWFLSVIWPWNSLLSLSRRRRRRTATASTSHACASSARSVSMGSNGCGSVWCVGLPGTVHHCAVLFAFLCAAQ